MGRTPRRQTFSPACLRQVHCTLCLVEFAPTHPWPANGVSAAVRPRTCSHGGCGATRTTKARETNAPRVRSGARTTSRPRSRANRTLATQTTRTGHKSLTRPHLPAAGCRWGGTARAPAAAAAGSRSRPDHEQATAPSQSLRSDQHARLLCETSLSAASRRRRRLLSPRRRRLASPRSSTASSRTLKLSGRGRIQDAGRGGVGLCMGKTLAAQNVRRASSASCFRESTAARVRLATLGGPARTATRRNPPAGRWEQEA